MSPRTDMRKAPVGRLIVLGESTAWGYSVTDKARCWANLLAAMIEEFQGSPLELINQSIGSNVLTTKCPAYEKSAKPAGLERLDQEVIALRPDLLVVSYGLNDSRGGTPVDVFRAEYQCLLDRVRARVKPLIVMVNTYYMLRYDSPGWDHADLDVTETFNEAIRDLAGHNGCIYADVFSAENGADWLIDLDRVHPNDLGHRVIANRIFEAIARNCSFLARTAPAEPNIAPFVLQYRNGPERPVVSGETVDFNYHLYSKLPTGRAASVSAQREIVPAPGGFPPLQWRRHCWRMHARAPGDNDPNLRFEAAMQDATRVANEVHFTALAALGEKLLCGLTHRGHELLLEFDPRSGSFRSLGFPSVSERHEVKLHRGLTRADDGNYYFGTASLMHTADCHSTPGGRLIRYNPAADTCDVLGRPVAETYIQSICLDEGRNRVYGNTWPARYFFDFDLEAQRTTLFYVENRPEACPCLDADGAVWNMYGFGYSTHQQLCRYDPDTRTMEWTRLELPGGVPGRAPATSDETVLWRGCIYFAASHLCRLDPRTMALEDLGTPVPGSERVPCLTIGPDGMLYGAGGRNGDYHLFRYDGDTFQDLGSIASADGEAPFVAHAVCFQAGRVYVGETDHPTRSGYLWEADSLDTP